MFYVCGTFCKKRATVFYITKEINLKKMKKGVLLILSCLFSVIFLEGNTSHILKGNENGNAVIAEGVIVGAAF